MTIIVVASVKGGMGKTTTSCSLASAVAHLEETLLVDLDSQGQVSYHFGLRVRSGLYEWLSGIYPLANCLVDGRPSPTQPHYNMPASGLFILPGDGTTKAVYNQYQGMLGTHQLAERFNELGKYPFVIMDTAAGGLLQEAALMVADHVVIPFRPEGPGIDGLFNTVQLVKELAPYAKLTVLPTGYDMRLREHKNNLIDLHQHFAEDTGLSELYAIRNRIAVAEAASAGVTIWEFSGSGIKDVRVGYTHLANRVLRLAGNDGSKGETLEAMLYGEKE